MEDKISYKEREHKDWHVWTVVGRIDTVTANNAEEKGMEVLNGNTKIALDMNELEYISSAGLRVLLRLGKKAKKEKKEFVVYGVKGMIKDVLEASGIDMLLTIYGTEDELP